MNDETEITLTSDGPDTTAHLARRVAALARPGMVIALRGDLGAGKSLFARALISSLFGHATEVPSPTFTLVQTYDTPKGRVWHFDLYRLKNADEVEELGWDDARADIMVIEWPDRAGSWLPTERLDINFVILGENDRRLHLIGPASWLAALQESAHG